MKISLEKINAAFPALEKLAEREMALDTSYKISKLIGLIKGELTEFEKASRKRAEALGLHVELPTDCTEDQKARRRELMSGFSDEAANLLAGTEIEIPDYSFELKDFGEAAIKPSALVGLGFLIRE